MSFYDEMQSIASDILTAFNQGGIVYIATIPGNGPADNPGPSTSVRYNVNGAARGVSFKYVQGGLAVAGDLQVTLAVSPSVAYEIGGFVEIAQKIVVNGVVYAPNTRFKVVQMVPKPAAGTPVAYTLIIRK